LTNLLQHSLVQSSQRLSARAGSRLREWLATGCSRVQGAARSLVERWRQFELEDEISLVLLAYFGILFGLLLLVHFLQPERPPTTGSSRSPMHQEQPLR
jgi:hypothetical protein